MALLIENISAGKVIGIGAKTVLPGETTPVPEEFEKNPILTYYAEKGFAKVTEELKAKVVKSDRAKVEDNPDASDAPKEDEPNAEETEEALRKARLTSLKNITEEALGKLAEEMGINPADCKDTADMKKKVREALKS